MEGEEYPFWKRKKEKGKRKKEKGGGRGENEGGLVIANESFFFLNGNSNQTRFLSYGEICYGEKREKGVGEEKMKDGSII